MTHVSTNVQQTSPVVMETRCFYIDIANWAALRD